jgi:hypothetical protein
MTLKVVPKAASDSGKIVPKKLAMNCTIEKATNDSEAKPEH